MLKKVFSISIKILLSIVLVFLVIKFTNLDIPSTIKKLKETNLWWFALTTVMYTLTVFTNNYRWILLARLLDYKINFTHGLQMYFEGAFSNNFLPTNFGGDALRAYDLSQINKKLPKKLPEAIHASPDELETPIHILEDEEHAKTKTIQAASASFLRAGSTVFMERLFGFAMMFGMIPIGLTLNKLSPKMVYFPPSFEIFMLLSFFGLIGALASYKLWTKIPLKIFEKLRFAISEYTKCHKSLAKVILWTFVTHMLLLAGNICSAYAVGVSLEELPFWYWLLITPASTLAGFIIPAVKGVGAKEASYIYFLGLVGISSETSLAIAFLSFLATTLSTLPGVTIAFRKFEKH